MEPNQSGIKTWQWVVTVIVIIALIIIGVLVFGSKGTDSPVTGDETPAITDETPGTVNRITMTDQYPGNVVYLSSVQLAKAGWVAIHKDNAGMPGAVIGSAYFEAGINPGKVTLSESLVDGGTYYAMLHSDDGDAIFSEAKDVPLKDANGNVIMKVFRGSASADATIKG
ncbi:MAG: hypothetical protein WC648_01040 [Candidatus Paceibacterota bacterium]|jgi:hypothetical protein